MHKTVTTFAAQLITLDAPLAFSEVTARLDKAINKERSMQLLPNMKRVMNRDEIDLLIGSICGTGDFLYFSEISHRRWRSIYDGKVQLETVLYTIGNPLLAHSLMHHDMRSALHVPLRLLVLEDTDNCGTKIMYHLPSSLLMLKDNPDLRADAEALDLKLEKMLAEVLEPQHVIDR